MVVKIAKMTIKRIVKEKFPEQKISDKALIRLMEVTTDFARMTVTDAKRFCDHARRKTILESDIILATS